MSLYDDVMLAAMEIEESRRTVICAPEDRLLCEVALGHQPLLEIQESQLVKPGMILVVDTNAIEASWRETMQHWHPTFE
jgi:hypothetical protein